MAGMEEDGVDRTEMFRYILNVHNGKCRYPDLIDYKILNFKNKKDIKKYVLSGRGRERFSILKMYGGDMVCADLGPAQMCPRYKYKGSYCRSQCDMFHLCEYGLWNNCKHKEKCQYFHDLQNEHNRNVVQRLYLCDIPGEDILLYLRLQVNQAILGPGIELIIGNDAPATHNTQGCNVAAQSQTWQPLTDNSSNRMGIGAGRQPLSQDFGRRSFLHQEQNALGDTGNTQYKSRRIPANNAILPSQPSNNFKIPARFQPALDRSELIHYILDQHNGYCRYQDLIAEELFGFRHEKDVQRYILLEDGRKRLSISSSAGIDIIYVSLEGAKICPKYKSNRTSCKSGCRMFHLCSHGLWDNCMYKSKCKYFHSLQNEHTRSVVRKLRLDDLADEDILLYLKLEDFIKKKAGVQEFISQVAQDIVGSLASSNIFLKNGTRVELKERVRSKNAWSSAVATLDELDVQTLQSIEDLTDIDPEENDDYDKDDDMAKAVRKQSCVIDENHNNVKHKYKRTFDSNEETRTDSKNHGEHYDMAVDVDNTRKPDNKKRCTVSIGNMPDKETQRQQSISGVTQDIDESHANTQFQNFTTAIEQNSKGNNAHTQSETSETTIAQDIQENPAHIQSQIIWTTTSQGIEGNHAHIQPQTVGTTGAQNIQRNNAYIQPQNFESTIVRGIQGTHAHMQPQKFGTIIAQGIEQNYAHVQNFGSTVVQHVDGNHAYYQPQNFQTTVAQGTEGNYAHVQQQHFGTIVKGIGGNQAYIQPQNMTTIVQGSNGNIAYMQQENFGTTIAHGIQGNNSYTQPQNFGTAAARYIHGNHVYMQTQNPGTTIAHGIQENNAYMQPQSFGAQEIQGNNAYTQPQNLTTIEQGIEGTHVYIQPQNTETTITQDIQGNNAYMQPQNFGITIKQGMEGTHAYIQPETTMQMTITEDTLGNHASVQPQIIETPEQNIEENHESEHPQIQRSKARQDYHASDHNTKDSENQGMLQALKDEIKNLKRIVESHMAGSDVTPKEELSHSEIEKIGKSRKLEIKEPSNSKTSTLEQSSDSMIPHSNSIVKKKKSKNRRKAEFEEPTNSKMSGQPSIAGLAAIQKTAAKSVTTDDSDGSDENIDTTVDLVHEFVSKTPCRIDENHDGNVCEDARNNSYEVNEERYNTGKSKYEPERQYRTEENYHPHKETRDDYDETCGKRYGTRKNKCEVEERSRMEEEYNRNTPKETGYHSDQEFSERYGTRKSNYEGEERCRMEEEYNRKAYEEAGNYSQEAYGEEYSTRGYNSEPKRSYRVEGNYSSNAYAKAGHGRGDAYGEGYGRRKGNYEPDQRNATEEKYSNNAYGEARHDDDEEEVYGKRYNIRKGTHEPEKYYRTKEKYYGNRGEHEQWYRIKRCYGNEYEDAENNSDEVYDERYHTRNDRYGDEESYSRMEEQDNTNAYEEAGGYGHAVYGERYNTRKGRLEPKQCYRTEGTYYRNTYEEAGYHRGDTYGEGYGTRKGNYEDEEHCRQKLKYTNKLCEEVGNYSDDPYEESYNTREGKYEDEQHYSGTEEKYNTAHEEAANFYEGYSARRGNNHYDYENDQWTNNDEWIRNYPDFIHEQRYRRDRNDEELSEDYDTRKGKDESEQIDRTEEKYNRNEFEKPGYNSDEAYGERYSARNRNYKEEEERYRMEEEYNRKAYEEVGYDTNVAYTNEEGYNARKYSNEPEKRCRIEEKYNSHAYREARNDEDDDDVYGKRYNTRMGNYEDRNYDSNDQLITDSPELISYQRSGTKGKYHGNEYEKGHDGDDTHGDRNGARKGNLYEERRDDQLHSKEDRGEYRSEDLREDKYEDVDKYEDEYHDEDHFHFPSEITNNQTDSEVEDQGITLSWDEMKKQGNVIEQLIKFPDGCATLTDLQKSLSDLFPTTNELLRWLLRRVGKKICVLKCHNFKQEHYVKILVQNCKLCFYYCTKGECQSELCQYVHLCRNYVAEICKNKNCSHSHDLKSAHNWQVIQASGVAFPTVDSILTVIRLSVPKICKDYQNLTRGCSKFPCARFHLCARFVQMICHPGCTRSHDIHDTYHNKALSRAYGFSPEGALRALKMTSPVEQANMKLLKRNGILVNIGCPQELPQGTQSKPERQSKQEHFHSEETQTKRQGDTPRTWAMIASQGKQERQFERGKDIEERAQANEKRATQEKQSEKENDKEENDTQEMNKQKVNFQKEEGMRKRESVGENNRQEQHQSVPDFRQIQEQYLQETHTKKKRNTAESWSTTATPGKKFKQLKLLQRDGKFINIPCPPEPEPQKTDYIQESQFEPERDRSDTWAKIASGGRQSEQEEQFKPERDPEGHRQPEQKSPKREKESKEEGETQESQCKQVHLDLNETQIKQKADTPETLALNASQVRQSKQEKLLQQEKLSPQKIQYEQERDTEGRRKPKQDTQQSKGENNRQEGQYKQKNDTRERQANQERNTPETWAMMDAYWRQERKSREEIYSQETQANQHRNTPESWAMIDAQLRQYGQERKFSEEVYSQETQANLQRSETWAAIDAQLTEETEEVNLQETKQHRSSAETWAKIASRGKEFKQKKLLERNGKVINVLCFPEVMPKTKNKQFESERDREEAWALMAAQERQAKQEKLTQHLEFLAQKIQIEQEIRSQLGENTEHRQANQERQSKEGNITQERQYKQETWTRIDAELRQSEQEGQLEPYRDAERHTQARGKWATQEKQSRKENDTQERQFKQNMYSTETKQQTPETWTMMDGKEFKYERQFDQERATERHRQLKQITEEMNKQNILFKSGGDWRKRKSEDEKSRQVYQSEQDRWQKQEQTSKHGIYQQETQTKQQRDTPETWAMFDTQLRQSKQERPFEQERDEERRTQTMTKWTKQEKRLKEESDARVRKIKQENVTQERQSEQQRDVPETLTLIDAEKGEFEQKRARERRTGAKEKWTTQEKQQNGESIKQKRRIKQKKDKQERQSKPEVGSRKTKQQKHIPETWTLMEEGELKQERQLKRERDAEESIQAMENQDKQSKEESVTQDSQFIEEMNKKKRKGNLWKRKTKDDKDRREQQLTEDWWKSPELKSREETDQRGKTCNMEERVKSEKKDELETQSNKVRDTRETQSKEENNMQSKIYVEERMETLCTGSVMLQILQEFDGCCPLKTFVRKFPITLTCEEAVSLLAKPSVSRYFTLFDVKSAEEATVLTRITGLKVCYAYMLERPCPTTNCISIHLCEEYLTGFYADGEECNLSHDIKDKHNTKVFDDLGLKKEMPEYLQLTLVRNSFPILCQWHNTLAGCGNPQCHRFHICIAHVKRFCLPQKCKYGHSFETSHNLKLIRLYGSTLDLIKWQLIASSKTSEITNKENEKNGDDAKEIAAQKEQKNKNPTNCAECGS